MGGPRTHAVLFSLLLCGVVVAGFGWCSLSVCVAAGTQLCRWERRGPLSFPRVGELLSSTLCIRLALGCQTAPDQCSRSPSVLVFGLPGPHPLKCPAPLWPDCGKIRRGLVALQESGVQSWLGPASKLGPARFTWVQSALTVALGLACCWRELLCRLPPGTPQVPVL